MKFITFLVTVATYSETVPRQEIKDSDFEQLRVSARPMDFACAESGSRRLEKAMLDLTRYEKTFVQL